MKKMLFEVNGLTGDESAQVLTQALNDLSGVELADVFLRAQKAYAFAGDKLSQESVVEAAQKCGYGASLIREVYVS